MIDLTLEQQFIKNDFIEQGKQICYIETFVSPFEKDTLDDAKRDLNAIREAHPVSSGWIEKSGFVEQLPNKKWRAVRIHEQYK